MLTILNDANSTQQLTKSSTLNRLINDNRLIKGVKADIIINGKSTIIHGRSRVV